MKWRPRNSSTEQSTIWQDPPPRSLPDRAGDLRPDVERPQAAGGPALNPLTERFFNSVFALAFQALFFLCLAALAGGLALSLPFGQIGQIMLGMVFLVMSLLGLSFLLSTLTLNVKQLFAIRMAMAELRSGTDLNGDGAVGAVNPDAPNAPWDISTPSPAPPAPTMAEEIAAAVTAADPQREVLLVPTNRPVRDVIKVGNVSIDKRDFLAFLARTWATNGAEEQGLARVFWCGGRKKDGSTIPRFVFERADGTTQECYRAYYDAIMLKLETLKEIEGRGNGWSGKLKRDPATWLSDTGWFTQ